MASSSCFICPGHARIYVSRPDGTTELPTTWLLLPHTVQVGVTPDVEEPTEIRTSDTGGKKVPACGGATSYALEVTSALCDHDWLYAYLLDSYSATPSAGDPIDPSKGADLWFCVQWSETPDTPDATWVNTNGVITCNAQGDNAIYSRGQVQPPGFGFDNDSSDPVTAEWSAELTWGPKFPVTSDGTGLNTVDL